MHDRMYGSEQRGNADWRVIAKLWPYLREHPRRLALAVGFLILAKLSFVVVPMVMKALVDALDRSLQPDVVEIALGIPLMLVAVYGVLRFANVLFNELRDAVFGRVAEGTLTRVGLVVFNHLHRLELEFHLSRRTGGLSRDIERGTAGVSFLLRAIVFSVLPILVEVLMVVGIFLIYFEWRYAAVLLVAIVIYIGFSVWVTEWRTTFVREANRKDSEANTRAIDSLLNYETVKYFNNEAYESARYEEQLRAREDAKVKNHLSLATLNTGQALIIALAVTAIMGMASQQVAVEQLTLGDLAMVNAYMIQVFIPLNALGFVYREIKRCLADVEAMFGLTQVAPGIVDKPGAPDLPASADGIDFNQVSFAYQTRRAILHDVSFQVKPGKKVAIVGASGAGKSTLVRLLYRFYDVSAGSIRIGGTDIRDVSQDSLRRAIGIVPQDTVLFNDTLYENLRYGNPDATREQIETAVEQAYLTDFIRGLPDGYETRVGERGLKVSGGEKQRIAIARAILKQPRILVFDEATSALDSVAERAILRAFNQLASRHTTVVIAHRLSTIVDADLIVVLDSGRVVEQGTHTQLLAEQAAYAHLWHTQHESLPGAG